MILETIYWTGFSYVLLDTIITIQLYFGSRLSGWRVTYTVKFIGVHLIA